MEDFGVNDLWSQMVVVRCKSWSCKMVAEGLPIVSPIDDRWMDIVIS